MRELGTPSPRKGLRGVLARARRAFGDDDAETRVRAMELTAKTDAVVAELGVSDVEIMIKNEMAAMSAMSDIATLEAKLDASLNGSDWLLDQSVDETPGKFDGGEDVRRRDGVADSGVFERGRRRNAAERSPRSSARRPNWKFKRARRAL